MNIAILGTGIVGNAIGTKLIQLGHSVRTCSRTVMNEKASAWVKANAKVLEILQTWFGWKSVIDLVEDSLRRHFEMLLPMWIRLYGKFQSPNFNFRVVR